MRSSKGRLTQDKPHDSKDFMNGHARLNPFYDQISQAEDDSTAARKGTKESGHTPFVCEIAGDFDLKRVVRMRGMGDLARVGWYIQGQRHSVRCDAARL